MSGDMRFVEHLAELRARLKVIFITLVALVLVVLLLPLQPSQLLNLNNVYYTTPASVFLQRLVRDVLPTGWTLIGFHVNEPLQVLLVASLVIGFALDVPVIAYEVFRFVEPALRQEERQLVYPTVASATILFIVGISFGYFILVRFIFFALAPFFVATQASFVIDVADFYSIVFLSIFFSGVAFTTPVFVYLLIRFGILSPDFFSKNRVLIWFGTYVVTALVTPDGGPLLDVVLFVPVIVLLEASVFVGRRSTAKTLKPTADPGPTCRYCGARLRKGEPFCPNCGRVGS